MTRTVKVGLDVDEQPFVRGFGRATDAAEKLDDALDDVTGSAKDTAVATDRAKDSVEDLGGSAKDAGDDLNRLRRDAERLDRQIDETTRGVRDLARAIAATSDEAERAKLTEKLGVEQGRLRQQTTLRRLIDFTDEEEVNEQGKRIGARLAENIARGLSTAGGPISRVLGNIFGTLPPQAQLGIGAGLVGAASAAAPLIGGVVSAAIVGAAGGGGIIGGVAIAARHPEVKASAKLTGEQFAESLQRAGVSFVPATLDALGQVRSRIGDIEDDFERAASASSQMLAPLTGRILDGAEDAVDGFATAVERSGPVVEALGDIAAEAGDLIGDTFEQLSEHSAEASRALRALWAVFELGIRNLVTVVDGLTQAYGWMEKIGAVLSGDPLKMYSLAASEEAARQSSGGLSQGMQDLIAGFADTESAAVSATADIETFAEMVRRLADENLTAEKANLRLEEAIDRAAEAAREGADKGIDPNTKAGRENRKALLDIAEAANTSADAILTQTGSQELASEATERGRTKFLEAADAMGVERSEARKLADQLFGIPEEVNSTVTVTANTQPALDRARGVVARINNMKARIRVEAEPSGGFGGSAHTGFGYSTGMRWGGVVEHAQDGLINLRQAAVYSPVAPARYAFAEPATGGEAFIPRFGDPDRSLGILSRAAQWYGAAVVPGGTGGMAAGGVPEVRVFIGDQELRGMVRVEVSEQNRQLKRRVSAGAGR